MNDFEKKSGSRYFNESVIRLFVVAPDNRLVRMIRSLNCRKQFEPIRFRSLENAVEKAKFDHRVVLLFQCLSKEVSESIAVFQMLTSSFFSARLFVYVPDLPKQNHDISEAVRFALLQAGITAVASSQLELKSLLPVFVESAKKTQSGFPAEYNPLRNDDLFCFVRQRLPWSGV